MKILYEQSSNNKQGHKFQQQSLRSFAAAEAKIATAFTATRTPALVLLFLLLLVFFPLWLANTHLRQHS